jgi:hypothetical protein
MFEDYTLATVSKGHIPSFAVIQYHCAGDSLGEETLELDDIRLAIMDINERIDHAEKPMDQIMAERVFTVAELYFLNFNESPRYYCEASMHELKHRSARLINMARGNIPKEERVVLKAKARKTIKEYHTISGV